MVLHRIKPAMSNFEVDFAKIGDGRFSHGSEGCVDATINSQHKASTRGNMRTRSREEVCCVCSADGGSKGGSAESPASRTFFHFPADYRRCRDWLQMCGRADLLGKPAHQLRTEGYKICSDHFDANQFQFSAGRIKRLVPGAVPTFPDRNCASSSTSSSLHKKRMLSGRSLHTDNPSSTQPLSSDDAALQQIDFQNAEPMSQNLMLEMDDVVSDDAALQQTHFQNAEPMSEATPEMDYAVDPSLPWITHLLNADITPEQSALPETTSTLQSWTTGIKIKAEAMETEDLDVRIEPPLTRIESSQMETKHVNTQAEHPVAHIKLFVTESGNVEVMEKTQLREIEPVSIKTEGQDIRTQPPITRCNCLIQDVAIKPLNLSSERLNLKSEPLKVGSELLNAKCNCLVQDVTIKHLDLGSEQLNLKSEPQKVGTELLNMKCNCVVQDVTVKHLDLSSEPLNLKNEPLKVGTEPLKIKPESL